MTESGREHTDKQILTKNLYKLVEGGAVDMTCLNEMA